MASALFPIPAKYFFPLFTPDLAIYSKIKFTIKNNSIYIILSNEKMCEDFDLDPLNGCIVDGEFVFILDTSTQSNINGAFMLVCECQNCDTITYFQGQQEPTREHIIMSYNRAKWLNKINLVNKLIEIYGPDLMVVYGPQNFHPSESNNEDDEENDEEELQQE